MTVIAFDGRFVAADRRMCFGSEISRRLVTKIHIKDGFVFAGTGYIHGGLLAKMIAQFTADVEEMHTLPWRKEPGNFINCGMDGIASVWSEGDQWGHPEQAPCAWGQGSDYATGAMHAGKNAMEAVEIACRLDSSCGGGVEFIDLSDLEKGVQTWAGGVPPLSPEVRRDIEKPRPLSVAGGVNSWITPECTGSLALGTGCGYCLRCNREWWVHVKLVGGDRDATQLSITPEMIEDAQARAAVVAPPSPMDLLKAHVRAWNNAAAKGDLKTTAAIDRKLMAFSFPPGVEMITRESAHYHGPERVIINDGDPAEL